MVQREHTTHINGIELFYQTRGEGPALLLLHGFFQAGAQWQPYLAELALAFHLVVPDLRGHGRSTSLSNAFSHRQAALDVYALLDELGLDSCRAVGFSTGGMTLLHMATQQPERIAAMVLFGATTHFPHQARTLMEATTSKRVPEEFLALMRRLHVRGEAQIQALFRQFRQMAAGDDMAFTPADLDAIAAKTLVVHGDRDQFFPLDIPLMIYRAIPEAALWIVPNAGHTDLLEVLASPTGTPTRFPALALEFLKTSGP